ncbi:MAG: GPI anchored serine-threonine rich family protein [Melioribacteraceae bacterium]|nr:GPI anchored serine-threonine rich family protein [Melioribacteraceae bacterium]
MSKNPKFKFSNLFLLIVVFLAMGAKDIYAQYEVHWNSPVFQNIRWERGETVTLTWRLAVTVSNNNYSILLRQKSGPTYSTAIPTPSCSGPSCSMQWTIPDYLPNGSDYYMVLSASNNNASDSEESVTFTIGPSPSETQVRLRSPDTGLENISTNPTLQWYAMNDAESYQFQLSNQPSMGTPLNID